MRRITDRASRASAGIGFVLVAASAACACRRNTPAFGKYEVASELRLPQGQPTPTPPESVLRPWRVWVNQERPRQKKAPSWHAYAAKEAALLDIAEDGRWRCLIDPVHVLGKANERGKLGSWIVSRSVKCSIDGFRTSVEARVQAAFDPEGKEAEATESVPLYLNDAVKGQMRSTAVVLEGEKQVRRPVVD